MYHRLHCNYISIEPTENNKPVFNFVCIETFNISTLNTIIIVIQWYMRAYIGACVRALVCACMCIRLRVPAPSV